MTRPETLIRTKALKVRGGFAKIRVAPWGTEMLALMIGAAILAVPTLPDDRHGAVMGASAVDLQSYPAGAGSSEGAFGTQFDFHRQPIRVDVSFDASDRRNDNYLPAWLIAFVHGKKPSSVAEHTLRTSSLPIAHLDPRDAQDQLADIGATVHDQDLQSPITIGGEGLRPMRALGGWPHDAIGEYGTIHRTRVVDEALQVGDLRRDCDHSRSNQSESPKEAQHDWSNVQTALGVLIVLSSIAIAFSQIAVLVIFFEFIHDSDERAWPIRIARIAMGADLVLALSFAAFVIIGR